MLNPPPPPSGAHAFEALTPDVVMDALASVGLYGDGRQLALSSYENRVYLLHLEDGEELEMTDRATLAAMASNAPVMR